MQMNSLDFVSAVFSRMGSADGYGVHRCDMGQENDIVVGNDVWIGYEAIILAGVTIGTLRSSAAARSCWMCRRIRSSGGLQKPIRKRFDEETIRTPGGAALVGLG